jgi:hypothetical protein
MEFLDGAVFGARRTRVGGWIGCSGEMGCSWALYIGQGRLAEAAEERSWWWPVEFNGAAVSSLESSLRGWGNGGVAPLQKGKRETKEEQGEWATKARLASFGNGKQQ